MFHMITHSEREVKRVLVITFDGKMVAFCDDCYEFMRIVGYYSFYK